METVGAEFDHETDGSRVVTPQLAGQNEAMQAGQPTDRRISPQLQASTSRFPRPQR